MGEQFRNNPSLHNASGETTIKRYTHQALQINHNGLKAAIQTNGKVVITGRPVASKDDPSVMEWDEVEVPASLIFKIAGLLRATRDIQYVAVEEVGAKGEK